MEQQQTARPRRCNSSAAAGRLRGCRDVCPSGLTAWVQRRAAKRTVRCNPLSAERAPIVHSDRAVAERRRRDQIEPSRAG
jgi:hypothetical protein